MSKLQRRFPLTLDRLEDRLVPAGNVTVSFTSSLLSITGDNEANGISLVNNGDGTFTLDSTDGDTTLNGDVGPLTVTATSTSPFRVKINMKGGDDSVDITAGGITVRGDSYIKLGAGNDTLNLDGILARDDALINGEGGDDAITVTNSGFDDDAHILGGSGDDTIVVDNVFFGEDARIDSGSGVDAVNITNGRFFEDAHINLGSGDDTMTVDDSVFHHDSRFSAGSGADVLTFINSRFDYDSRFDLGSGDDEILLGGNFFNKKAGFDGGKGFDTFTHDGTNIWAAKHKVKNFELFQLGDVVPVTGVVANDDAAAVATNGTVTFDVVGNDVAPEGAALDLTTLVITSGPAQGNAIVNADGSITYTNTGGVAGTDTLTYTINDDLGNISNEATVTITITAEA